MGSKSDYLENKLIDHIFRDTAFTKPAALHVGLFTSTPSDTGGGTEVSGGSYARAQLNPDQSNWAATQGGTGGPGASSGTGGATSNLAAITFPSPTGNWGTVTSFGIFDNSSGGNLLYWGALASNKTINNGDAAPVFAIGDLVITEG